MQGNPVIIQYMRKKVFRDVRMNLNQYTGYVFALTCILMHGSVCIYAAGSAYAALRALIVSTLPFYFVSFFSWVNGLENVCYGC